MPNLPVSIFDFSLLAGAANNLLYWMTILFLILSVVGVAFFFMHLFSFKYVSETGRELLFDPEGKPYLGKAIRNRFRLTKDKSKWQKLWPLFNKTTFPVFPLEAIKRRNRVSYCQLPDGKCIPSITELKISTDKNGHEYSAEHFYPFPHTIREHYYNELEDIKKEFEVKTKWEENKPFFIAIITVGLCCLLCGVTIYFTFHYAGGAVVDAVNAAGPTIADALKDAAQNIPARTA